MIPLALDRSRLAFFFLQLPFGHHGPVSELSVSKLSELFCTGPFNWGGAHCAGEKVKQSRKEDHYDEVSS